MSQPSESEIEVFNATLELPVAERVAYLDQVCAGDAPMRRRVELLILAHESAGTFLHQPTSPAAGGTVRLPAIPTEKPGDKIGRYKLLEKIGEGGCGVVYMAEQEEPVRRRVALKVIKLGMDTKQVIARFEAERQALALMDHPNIAKVLDAGATDTGRPYFVMELVRGIKITDFCDENKLSTADRLKLFIQVCQAIQHAHQKGVIHRDIKPSNILVTVNDGVPVPKVIDFGIAKATQGRLTDHTLFTAFEQFIGTPAYMSPEQAVMTSLDIDTRSDIYSLGVLLYELLTGRTPFDQKELLAAGLDEMRRTIREKEPPKPSTVVERLSKLRVERGEVPAPQGGSALNSQLKSLSTDLDWIVMKCLEKDRARRYETANGVATDITRHLNCEPVVARPPSRLYEFQKTVRRHKFGFAAAGAVGAALVLGMVGSVLEAARAKRAEWDQIRLRQQAVASQKQSQTEAAKATAISDFLQQLLSSANPYALKGSEYTVRQLLDDFSAGLGTRLAGQPEVEATVRATIGNSYRQLGLAEKAEPHLERALTLKSRVFGEQSQEFAQSLVDRAWNLSEQARWAEAEAQIHRALDIFRGSGADAQPLIHAWYLLGVVLNLQKRFKEVETVSEQALALARDSTNRDFPDLANLIHNLADTKVSQAKYVEAENLALQAGEMHRRLQGAEHPETAWSLVILGRALAGQHKLAEAERAYEEAWAIFRKYYSVEHNNVQLVVLELGGVLEAKRDPAALEALYRKVLAGQRAALSNDSPAVAATLRNLAASLDAQGKQAEAETLLRQAIATQSKLRGESASLRSSYMALAELLWRADRVAESTELTRKAIGALDRAMADSPAERQQCLEPQAHNYRHLGFRLQRLRDFSGARAAFSASTRFFSECAEKASVKGKATCLLGQADNFSQLGELWDEEARPAEAREAYRQSLALHELIEREGLAPQITSGWAGEHYAKMGQLVEKTGTPEDALRISRLLNPPEPTTRPADLHGLAICHFRLGNLLRKNGKADESRQQFAAAEQAVSMWAKSSQGQAHGQLAEMTLALLGVGTYPEAELLARKCLAIREKEIPDDWRTFNARSMLGGALLGLKKYADAEPLLLSGYEGMKRREANIPLEGKPRLRETLQRLVQLYEETNRPDQAAGWRKKLAEAKALLEGQTNSATEKKSEPR